MNVTVFGSTGAIGSLTVDELLERGHTVTAYARNTQKVPAAWASNERVRVVIGEMSDADAIGSAIADRREETGGARRLTSPGLRCPYARKCLRWRAERRSTTTSSAHSKEIRKR